MNNKQISLSVPNLNGNELKYVSEAINTGWVSSVGQYVNLFEDKLSKYVNSVGAVSCQNGTSGLHISLILCGVTSSDEVIVPTLTFIAAVNPVKYIRAEPVFMDCDDSLCIDPEKLKKFCEEECEFLDNKLINKLTRKHIKAIVVVHVFGNMADMERIMNIAEKYNLKVIEDATEALGSYYISGKYKNKFAGTIGDIGVYSFNGNKIITTGGGGMIVSNNKDFLKKARHLTTQAKSDEVYFMHDEIGYNYRMTNVQAAIGVAQLEQLENFIFIKQKNYDLYKQKLSKIKDIRLLDFRSDIRSNKWLYGIICGPEYKMNRDELIKYLSSKNIQTRPIWGLIHEQKPYIKCRTYMIEKAKYYWRTVVNIPCSTNLITEDIDYVVENLM